jgi:3-hydroxyisobutyrate dehydrogenase-like beta-hydroxyacid dehydrogenase
MIEGLDIGGYLHFDLPYIEKVCCLDEVDKAILEELYTAGERGILPKDIVHDLKPLIGDRWQVLHRIQHMNKRLDLEIAQKVAEKRGHEWALTSFARNAYDLTKEKLERSIEE